VAAYPKAVVLGLTATPVRADGKPLSALYSDIVSVSTVPQLIRMGYLVRPRHYAPERPDLTKVGAKGGDYDERELSIAVDKPDLVGNIVAEFLGAGIRAEHVDGTTPLWQRNQILQRFASGETTVVSSVGIMTEGYDNPRISAVVLARPTMSLGLYLQMVGRGLRTLDGKSDCLILDHAGCCHAHGFSDDEREWSLDGKPKRAGAKREAPVSVCPECFASYPAARRECPECGYQRESQQDHTVEVDESAQIVEITDAQRLAMARARRRQEAQAQTLQELLDLARERGYKPGWAYVRYKERMKRRA
jgi:DNA repair protein RadD